MGKPQLTQLPNYQNYQNAIKVKMTILKLCLPFHFQYFLSNQSKYTSVTKQFKHAQNCKNKKLNKKLIGSRNLLEQNGSISQQNSFEK